jgi:hypothetical protein
VTTVSTPNAAAPPAAVTAGLPPAAPITAAVSPTTKSASSTLAALLSRMSLRCSVALYQALISDPLGRYTPAFCSGPPKSNARRDRRSHSAERFSIVISTRPKLLLA